RNNKTKIEHVLFAKINSITRNIPSKLRRYMPKSADGLEGHVEFGNVKADTFHAQVNQIVIGISTGHVEHEAFKHLSLHFRNKPLGRIGGKVGVYDGKLIGRKQYLEVKPHCRSVSQVAIVSIFGHNQHFKVSSRVEVVNVTQRIPRQRCFNKAVLLFLYSKVHTHILSNKANRHKANGKRIAVIVASLDRPGF